MRGTVDEPAVEALFAQGSVFFLIFFYIRLFGIFGNGDSFVDLRTIRSAPSGGTIAPAMQISMKSLWYASRTLIPRKLASDTKEKKLFRARCEVSYTGSRGVSVRD